MDSYPFLDHIQYLWWQMTFQNFIFLDIYYSNILIVDCMDMWWVVFCLLKVHTDYNPIEPR